MPTSPDEEATYENSKLTKYWFCNISKISIVSFNSITHVSFSFKSSSISHFDSYKKGVDQSTVKLWYAYWNYSSK